MPQQEGVVPRPDEPAKPYDICDSEPSSPPALPGDVEVGKNADHVLDMVSAELLIESERRTHRGETFRLAVSGSETIARFMERMMYNPDMRSFPWARTECWLLDDVESGERFDRLHSTLVPHSGIDETYLHGAAESMQVGEFDYVLLDIGADGRVGGLQAAPSGDEIVTGVEMINRAQFIALIGMGRDVYSMLQEAAEGEDSSTPVQQIRSQEGMTKWYLSLTTTEEDTRYYEE